jgi:tetratricopeptide (TPR) repeat protein
MWILLLALLAQSPDFTAQGLKALDDRQYEVAAGLFTKAVAANPKDYAAHFNLALAYSLAGQDAQAIPEYRAVLELQPGLYQAEINLAISLITAKNGAADPAAAIPYLQQAAAQKPMEFSPAFYLGEALLDRGQLVEAAAAYSSALALNPNSAPAELGFGRATARQGARKSAEQHYRKAGALDPAYRDFLLELASLYEDHPEDVTERTAAITIYGEFPQNPGAQERMGVLLLESGDVPGAVAALEIAVAKSPTAANRVALAQAYVKSNQPAKAESQVAQALAAAPQDFELRLFYGRLLRDQHKFPDAAREFIAVAQQKPDSVPAWSELSGVLISAEQYPQALAALDHVRALGAEAAGHYFFRAVVLEHLQQRKEAIAAYTKFLDMSQGKNPDQEFQARQRVRILQNEQGGARPRSSKP